MHAIAQLGASLPTNSLQRENVTRDQVKAKYDKMLHPPLTYLGDAFKYRQADGKYNSALHPHLGQAGAPYAKTVPSVAHPLGALPDPGDIFDRLMARDEDRPSTSGLSSMLVYHATIIIHDIFRTNDKDKNISDTSSYLDLSPLYGFTDDMQRKVRDSTYKQGLLKPDTFAEDRLLRQPPGVCIMLVMYNRYHNHAATQLRQINENNRFRVPEKFGLSKVAAVVKEFVKEITAEQYKNYLEWLNLDQDDQVRITTKAEIKAFHTSLGNLSESWKQYEASGPISEPEKSDSKLDQDYADYLECQRLEEQYESYAKNAKAGSLIAEAIATEKDSTVQNSIPTERRAEIIAQAKIDAEKALSDFRKEYDAAWDKLDDDLFNTARL